MKVKDAVWWVNRCLEDLKRYINNKSGYAHETIIYPNGEGVIHYKGVFSRIDIYDKCIKFKTVKELITEKLNNLFGVNKWEIKFGYGVEVWKW